MCAYNNIPFLDLVTTHLELEQALTEVFKKALRSAQFVGGSMVEEFEKAFAQFCDTKYAIGVGSGTDALRFALLASGVQSGDVVVTVPNTFIATTEAISQVGALPEFVDIEEHTYNMDPFRLKEYLENQCCVDAAGKLISCRSGRPVTAVIPVHLYGHPADMDAIMDLAERYGLIVIEDACQAHGAEYFSRKQGCWVKAGSIGRASAFSFYPGKNLGACGEAGAVTTNDPDVAQKVKMLRDHGQARKCYHEVEGYNGRLDCIQAGLLQVKLPHLGRWNEQRRQRAAEYKCLLARSKDVVIPFEAAWSRPVYHLYVVRVPDQTGLIAYLKKVHIDTGIHYPIPLHLQNAYKHLNYSRSDFFIAERVAKEIVSLPMFPQLTQQQQTRVAQTVLEFVGNQAARGGTESVSLQQTA